MVLNLTQFIRTEPGTDVVIEAVKQTWTARTAVEEARYQYALGRAFMMLTAGTYLYDQQGWLNVMIEARSMDLKKLDVAVQSGNKAAAAPANPTSQPTFNPLTNLLNDIEKADKGK